MARNPNNTVTHKQCAACGRVLLREEYYPHQYGNTGGLRVRSRCKDCLRLLDQGRSRPDHKDGRWSCLTVSLTTTEKDRVRVMADEMGLSVAALVRLRLFGRTGPSHD